MPKDFSRTLRIGEQIHRELSELIRREINDPRIGMLTIDSVDVTSDLSYATVYYTVMGNDGSLEDTQRGLEHAKGYLRRLLGKRLHTRLTPELRFVYDRTLERSYQMDELIANARSRDQDLAEDEE